MNDTQFCEALARFIFIPKESIETLIDQADALDDKGRASLILKLGRIEEQMKKNNEEGVALQNQLSKALMSVESDFKHIENHAKRTEEEKESTGAASVVAEQIDNFAS
ncbi:MAG: hypothetical protein WCG83_02675 [Candidatus Peregrinibacteria bacterium]